MEETGQLLETYARGGGSAGEIVTLVAVTHHAGSGVTPGTYYLHHNHRGDVVLGRRGTRTVSTYAYSAFGSLTSVGGTDVSRFKFSSKERDPSTGFSYYGYRFYSPQWQRWVGTDFMILAWNLSPYHFVYNNPIAHVDPNGLDVWVVQQCNYLLGLVNVGHCYVVGDNGDGTYWESDLMPSGLPLNCPGEIYFHDRFDVDPRNLPAGWIVKRHVVCSPEVDKKVRAEAQRRAREEKPRYDLIGYNCSTYANAICDYAVGVKLRELIEKCRKCKDQRRECQ